MTLLAVYHDSPGGDPHPPAHGTGPKPHSPSEAVDRICKNGSSSQCATSGYAQVLACRVCPERELIRLTSSTTGGGCQQVNFDLPLLSCNIAAQIQAVHQIWLIDVSLAPLGSSSICASIGADGQVATAIPL